MTSFTFTPVIQSLSRDLCARHWQMACVESCTGGGLMAQLTDYAGASEWFYGGFVTYDNAAKIALGVSPTVLQKHGAVSAEVAQEMTRAAFSNTAVPLIIAITGIAGPNGASLSKPVGTVFIDVLCAGTHHTQHHVLTPPQVRESTRDAIRHHAQFHAAQLALQVLRELN